MKVKSQSEVAQSCQTPSDPIDCSLSGSSVHGIFQARALEWGAIAFSETHIAAAAAAKSLQLCPTLCDPIDGSPLDSSVLGILQARILEWVAIALSSLPRIGYFLLVCELLVISGSGFFSLVPHLGKKQH